MGTLNRVMIVELSLPATIVAVMIALPVLIAPFRALLGFKSDNYRSAIGWKRIPYLWFGSLWQMGGLAVMPAHKGFAWVEVAFRGRAAHGSRPDVGVDAIRHAAALLQEMDVLEVMLQRYPFTRSRGRECTV